MGSREKVVQCKTCPWRTGCTPDTDIPNYERGLHEDLDDTIAEPGDLSGLSTSSMRLMACHYSKPGEEFPCAGWLHHQLGIGNNIAVRLRVMTGQLPVPEVDGPQHERFEDTLCALPALPATRSRATSPVRRPKKRKVWAMTSYERKIKDAFDEVNKANGGQGASAAEVTEVMTKHGTLSELDTVIDIADIMKVMASRGYFSA